VETLIPIGRARSISFSRMGWSLAASLAFFFVSTASIAQTVNGGFERSTSSNDPAPWQINPNGYIVEVTDAESYSGSRSLLVKSTAVRIEDRGASIVQLHYPRRDHTHRYSLKAQVKVAGVEDGQAALWAMAKSGDLTVFFDNMAARGLTGTKGWQPLVLDIELPESTDVLIYGLLLSGTGTAWFDDVVLEDAPAVSGSPEDSASHMLPKAVHAARQTGRALPAAELEKAAREIADLAAMSRAEVFALGEFSHGSYEADQLQLHVAKWLYQVGLIDTIALEASTVACSGLPAIVTADDATSLEPCLAGQKSTDTYRALLDWARSTWTTEKPLAVVGIDTYVPGDAILELAEMLKSLAVAADSSAPDEIPDLSRQLAAVAKSPAELTGLDADVLDTAMSAADRAGRLLAGKTFELDSFRRDDLVWRFRNLRSYLEQCSLGTTSTEAKLLRDRMMAENVLWVHESISDTSVLVLAHNAHVRRKNHEVIEFGSSPLPRAMGEFLNDALVERYFVIGTHARRGYSREPVVGVIEFGVDGAEQLRESELPRSNETKVIDLRASNAGVPKIVSALEGNGLVLTMDPRAQYDVLVLFPTSTASTLN